MAMLEQTNVNAAGQSTYEVIKQELRDMMADPALWAGILVAALRIIAIVVAARIVIKLARKAIHHFVTERDKVPVKYEQRRTKTIAKLLGNAVSHTVNFIMLLLILNQLGFQMGPLLAGAGVIGLAIGFGAQSLVKDVITGFFIVFEDQFAVGDVIQANGVKGSVEEIGLRVTKIKSWNGELHFIPNGSIGQVTNFSLYNSVAAVDISIAYEEDIESAIRVIKSTIDRVYQENEDMAAEPKVLGVQTLGASEVVVRVTTECKPNKHMAVARLLNKEIKKSLDANGIEIPYPRMVTFRRTEQD